MLRFVQYVYRFTFLSINDVLWRCNYVYPESRPQEGESTIRRERKWDPLSLLIRLWADYSSDLIRETMRIFPPASTLRRWDNYRGQVGTTSMITDPKTGKQLPLVAGAGHAIWPLVHLIARNERFFPEPTKFIPERFIQSRTPYPDAELFTTAGKDAFRPFENTYILQGIDWLPQHSFASCNQLSYLCLLALSNASWAMILALALSSGNES